MIAHLRRPCPPARPRPRAATLATFAVLAVALAALAPASLHAQRVVSSIDVGGAQVRYADSITTSAATISPAIRVQGDRVTLGAGGSYSQVAGGWSSQGALQASAFTPAAGLLVGELSAAAGGSAHWDGTRTGRTLAVARAHLMRGTRGLWAGTGAGTTWDVGGWKRADVAELGAWSRFGRATGMATFTPTRVADTIRYADAEVALRIERRRFELGITGGHRAGDRLPMLDGAASSWGSASVVAWTGRNIAVVASAGAYPMDLMQGFPGGRFASLGLRFGVRPPTRAEREEREEQHAALEAGPAPLPADAPLREIRVAAASGGRRTIRVHAPGARAVGLRGDFTAWQPIRLTAAGDGWWTATLPIMAGVHEVTVRVDEGDWTPPPGVATLRDEFGGVVGLLVVPEQ